MKNLKMNNKGFTLIELLVGSIILVMIAIPVMRGFLTAMQTTAKSWNMGYEDTATRNIVEMFRNVSIPRLATDEVTIEAEYSVDYAFYEEDASVPGRYQPISGSVTDLLATDSFYLGIKDYSVGGKTYDAAVKLDFKQYETINDKELAVYNELEGTLIPTEEEAEINKALALDEAKGRFLGNTSYSNLSLEDDSKHLVEKLMYIKFEQIPDPKVSSNPDRLVVTYEEYYKVHLAVVDNVTSAARTITIGNFLATTGDPLQGFDPTTIISSGVNYIGPTDGIAIEADTPELHYLFGYYPLYDGSTDYMSILVDSSLDEPDSYNIREKLNLYVMKQIDITMSEADLINAESAYRAVLRVFGYGDRDPRIKIHTNAGINLGDETLAAPSLTTEFYYKILETSVIYLARDLELSGISLEKEPRNRLYNVEVKLYNPESGVFIGGDVIHEYVTTIAN